jgi:hypothetical protein
MVRACGLTEREIGLLIDRLVIHQCAMSPAKEAKVYNEKVSFSKYGDGRKG